jgi:SNF2 family DNA or RNA helicase
LESDNPELAIERLKTLLRFIMLRRPKDILSLPRRTDIVIPLGFDDQDKAKYDQAKRAIIRYFDEKISSEDGGNGFVNVMSHINALRMLCNLGCSTDPKGTPSDAAASESSSQASLDREDLEAALVSGNQPLHQDDLTESTSTCTICGILILTSPEPEPEPEPENSLSQRMKSIASKGSTQCRSCFSDSIGALGNSDQGAPMLELESQLSMEGTLRGHSKPSIVLSTKVKALVSDLTSQGQAKKRSVQAYKHNVLWENLSNRA